MPNYAKLFREAVRDSVRDHARDNPETITPGYWLGKLAKGGPDVPCAIWRCNHEPGNPENELDTGPIWIATIGDQTVDPLDVMAVIDRRPISKAAHAFRVAEMAWLQDWGAPTEPLRRPRRRVDVTKIDPVGPK